MGLARYTRRTLLRELALIVVAVVFCLPFYLLVAIALEIDRADLQGAALVPLAAALGATSPRPGTPAGRAASRHALESSLIITVSSVACADRARLALPPTRSRAHRAG